MGPQLKTEPVQSHAGVADQDLKSPVQKEEKLASEYSLRKQVEKLNQVGIALSSETNLETLLELIIHEARGFTGADAGSLYILDNGKLYFRVAQNDTLQRRLGSSPDFKPYPLPLSEGSIAGYVASTATILNIDNVYELPRTVPYHFNADFDTRNNYTTRSMLVVPMEDQGGEILGVLQLINAKDETGAVVPFERSVEHLVMSLASQAAIAIRNAKLIADIKALFDALIRYSISAIDARSPHTAGHSERVAGYAEAISRAINDESTGPFQDVSFTSEQMEELRYAAWLHDIGKIGVSEHILDKRYKLSDKAMANIATRFELIKLLIRAQKFNPIGRNNKGLSGAISEQTRKAIQEVEEDFNLVEKINRSPFLSDKDLTALQGIASKRYADSEDNLKPYLTDQEVESLSVRTGNLTDDEYSRMQTHAEHTYNIVKNIPFTRSLKNVPLIAATHHEFLDGTGYPRGLKSDELPLQSRILAVADIFDALTAVDRPYRSAMTVSEACQALRAHAKAGRLDYDVVTLFVEKELYK